MGSGQSHRPSQHRIEGKNLGPKIREPGRRAAESASRHLFRGHLPHTCVKYPVWISRQPWWAEVRNSAVSAEVCHRGRPGQDLNHSGLDGAAKQAPRGDLSAMNRRF